MDETNGQDFETESRHALIEAWKVTFGQPPAKKLSASLMAAALAYEVQCKASGGLSKRDRQHLTSLAGSTSLGASPAKSRAAPGTLLLREWNGRSYQVEVVTGGYVLDGTLYRSLSAVAKKITGAHWSGPRFFGVAG